MDGEVIALITMLLGIYAQLIVLFSRIARLEGKVEMMIKRTYTMEDQYNRAIR